MGYILCAGCEVELEAYQYDMSDDVVGWVDGTYRAFCRQLETSLGSVSQVVELQGCADVSQRRGGRGSEDIVVLFS